MTVRILALVAAALIGVGFALNAGPLLAAGMGLALAVVGETWR